MKKPLVSCIITSRNSGAYLKSCLQSLAAQSYSNIEIIVVDNKSTDETLNIAKQFTKQIYTYGPERSAQRNFGVKKSSGTYVVIIDSDMELTTNVIQECVSEAERAQVGGIIIPEKSVGSGFWAKVKAEERSWYLGDEQIEAERFYRKDLFLRAGGYDESITGPEDWDLPKRTRAMAKHGRIKSLIIHHEGKQSLLKMAQKKYYYGLQLGNYLNKNNQSSLHPQQVYFLRQSVLKNIFCVWRDPAIYLGIWLMFALQTFAGGLGYIAGKLAK